MCNMIACTISPGHSHCPGHLIAAMLPAAAGCLSPEAESLRTLVQGLCKVSSTLTDHEAEWVLPQGLEAFYTHKRAAAHRFIADAAGQPLLLGYACDGTPL